MNGKYGPYVKWGKVNATLLKIWNDSLELEAAVLLISRKIKKVLLKKAEKNHDFFSE